MIFNWEFYINKYADLKALSIKTEKESWNHWLKHGKCEERIYNDIPIFFNWNNYINKNIDLKQIQTEEDAWKHFLYYGRSENRTIMFNNYLIKYCV